MFSRKLIVLIIILLSATWISAQTDNLFWFAAPDISSDHGNAPKNGAPIYLHVTAVHPTTVTITQPANPSFTPIVFSLDEMEHRTIQLDAIMGIDQIENYPQKLPQPPASIQKKAFKITSSPGDITVYYELDNYYNRDIFPLKGRNALGTNFFVSTQNHFPNGDYAGTAWSGFVVTATENNTRIVVYPNDDWLYFDTNPGDSIVLNLNAGETFAFRAASTAANRHINGVPVKSNKDIVVTVYDDSMRKKHTNNTNCNSNLSFDTFGDQIIPIELVGHEYIIMKGQVTVTNDPNCPADGGERIFITAIHPNTQIRINGEIVATINNAGQVYNYQIDDPYVHLEASYPVYVNHVTGFGGELGGAVLPTIDGCTGSYSVSFTRTPNTNDAFFMNIMARNDTVDSSPEHNMSAKSFTIYSGGITTAIPEEYFEYFMDSTWIVLKKTAEVNSFIASKILTGNEARVSNSVSRFHLGIINGGTSTGCKYGYFSDYKSNFVNAGIGGANATKLKTFCSIDPIHLVATGGKRYKWFGESNPDDTLRLSSTTVADPYFSPETGGFYRFGVRVSRECFGDTILHVGVYVIPGPVALFEVETIEGCSPFTAVFTNLSDPNKAVQNYWNFDTRYSTTVPQSSLTNPFTYTFPENFTDSIQQYTVRLTVKGDFNMCPNSREKIIRIKPGIKAGITADNALGCPPLPVHFSDTSIGYIDTLNSYWDFGNYQQGYEKNPDYVFYNNRVNDITYNVKLIAYSKYGCVDTAEFPVHVYPHIDATFGITEMVGCSPFKTELNPLGSVGVNKYYWTIRDRNGSIIDSSFTKTDANAFTFTHNDNSQPLPDTIYASMYGENTFGCTDTAISKRMIIYPEVHAKFTASDHIACDSTIIAFNNNSLGYKLTHEWSLGDGTYFVDTTGKGFSHRYFNRFDELKNYTVRLVTTSDYFCADTLMDTITIYPFVKANFAIDYESNCSPLDVAITNTSAGGNEYTWRFGDGSTYSTSTKEPLKHVYENDTDNDKTFYINLTAQNIYGCADSIKRSVFLFPRVVAAFDFDSPNEGCNPLTVGFVNQSTGQNLDYIWDFGDKTYSTSQNPPPRTYKNSSAKDTTYYVNLTVMNLAGCDSSITKPIKVYSKVTADFAIEKLNSCSPFKISVDNYSSGGISEFTWKYTEEDSITLLTFKDPDIPIYRNTTGLPIKYPIVLRTRNAQGCTALKADTITVYPEVYASFTPGVTEGCQPLSVPLTNNTNIINGTSFLWNFGDGKYSNLATPTAHQFNNYSTNSIFRDIKLAATSQYGCYDDTTITVEVYPYIYAKFSIDRPEACSHELFTIDRNHSAGAINHYYWDWEGDGFNDEDKNTPVFTHFYSNTGSVNIQRNIKLTVTNTQGCDTSWTESIVIHPQVRAAFDYDNQEVCYPSPIRFTNNTTPSIPLNYYWEFGDGSSSSDKNPVHAYRNFSRTEDRQFIVKLTASSEYGCDSTITKSVIVHPKPLADFNFPQAVDCPPFEVQFNETSIGTNLSYQWDFDNGNSSTLPNPVQLFQNTGSDVIQHNISLIVTTEHNCSDTVVKPIQVYPGVSADFEASEWEGCTPMRINLNGIAENEDEYYWYVDGKVISNSEDPSYRFINESGTDKTFEVRFLAVSANGCSKDTTKYVTIYPKPIAEFLPTPQVQDYNTLTDKTEVTFNNQTGNQSSWSYKWDFGDGTTSSESSSSFTRSYTIWGDINNENRIPVILYATNANHPQCADTIMQYIVIKPPVPQINIGPDVSGCMPLTVDFSATSKYAYKDSYSWDFGYNGLQSDKRVPNPVTFDTAGVYIVKVTVKGDGGINWDYKTVQVYPKPLVDFIFDPKFAFLRSQTEKGTPIKFFNNTYNAVAYEWDFDDGSKSNERQPQHEYTEEGTYYVSLWAESEFGCWDTLTSKIPVVIEGHGYLKFPNAITIIAGNPADEYYKPGPNADRGVFRPLNEGVDKYKLEIYNRWGELIFVSKDVNRGWNGFINGEPVKQDVYVWRVTATFTNGQPYVAGGDVTVLVRPQ